MQHLDMAPAVHPPSTDACSTLCMNAPEPGVSDTCDAHVPTDCFEDWLQIACTKAAAGAWEEVIAAAQRKAAAAAEATNAEQALAALPRSQRRRPPRPWQDQGTAVGALTGLQRCMWGPMCPLGFDQ